jgi:hypothetical protein
MRLRQPTQKNGGRLQELRYAFPIAQLQQTAGLVFFPGGRNLRFYPRA